MLAIMITPLAMAVGEGDPITGGERNPNNNQTQELTEETEIIADTPTDSYGTRQSNKGEGGGAIYGCRADLDSSALGDPASTTPCLRANNLGGGEAFQFETDGQLAGVIQNGDSLGTLNPNAKPFITNATGVANGLNADDVDGMDAQQIIAEAVRQANENVDPQYRQP
ncbi:MAG: hypothetical protein MSC31_03505 [Solirubrobacteraceae bacterium MAG38_C4-C5]|nr:hypothetical protein [Candidatus Siliceabacter maunaloa]